MCSLTSNNNSANNFMSFSWLRANSPGCINNCRKVGWKEIWMCVCVHHPYNSSYTYITRIRPHSRQQRGSSDRNKWSCQGPKPAQRCSPWVRWERRWREPGTTSRGACMRGMFSPAWPSCSVPACLCSWDVRLSSGTLDLAASSSRLWPTDWHWECSSWCSGK